jgi:(p)ppGpp synthase/HD superfamily hydrolase
VARFAPEYDQPVLTDRFQAALAFAAQIHEGHARKRSQVPYLSHLLSVAALVLEDGGGEDEAIAALLHDAIEDQGDRTDLADIRRRFGDSVAMIVEACSDTDERPKPPWRGRKEAFIDRMRAAPPDVLRVACADKLHNARSTLADLRLEGARAWEKFGAGRDEQLWYYGSLSELFSERMPGPLSSELARTVAEIRNAAVAAPA